jgi:hypothetical protein
VNTEEPDIFWSRWNHWTSPVNVRFLTGVQRRLAPSCETLKSGYRCRRRAYADQCLARVAGVEGGAIGALGRRGSRTQQVVVRAAVIA